MSGIKTSDIQLKSIGEHVLITLELGDTAGKELLFVSIQSSELKKGKALDAGPKTLSKIPLKSQIEVPELCDKAKLKIAEGDSESALRLLTDKMGGIAKEFHNALILMSSEINILNKKARLGLEACEQLSLDRKKITFSLLELIDRIKECADHTGG